MTHEGNPQEYTFVSRLAKDGLFVKIGKKKYPIIFENYDRPVVSRKGKLMMCIGGFKDAVVNHEETIVEFLDV